MSQGEGGGAGEEGGLGESSGYSGPSVRNNVRNPGFERTKDVSPWTLTGTLWSLSEAQKHNGKQSLFASGGAINDKAEQVFDGISGSRIKQIAVWYRGSVLDGGDWVLRVTYSDSTTASTVLNLGATETNIWRRKELAVTATKTLTKVAIVRLSTLVPTQTMYFDDVAILTDSPKWSMKPVRYVEVLRGVGHRDNNFLSGLLSRSDNTNDTFKALHKGDVCRFDWNNSSLNADGFMWAEKTVSINVNTYRYMVVRFKVVTNPAAGTLQIITSAGGTATDIFDAATNGALVGKWLTRVIDLNGDGAITYYRIRFRRDGSTRRIVFDMEHVFLCDSVPLFFGSYGDVMMAPKTKAVTTHFSIGVRNILSEVKTSQKLGAHSRWEGSILNDNYEYSKSSSANRINFIKTHLFEWRGYEMEDGIEHLFKTFGGRVSERTHRRNRLKIEARGYYWDWQRSTVLTDVGALLVTGPPERATPFDIVDFINNNFVNISGSDKQLIARTMHDNLFRDEFWDESINSTLWTSNGGAIGTVTEVSTLRSAEAVGDAGIFRHEMPSTSGVHLQYRSRDLKADSATGAFVVKCRVRPRSVGPNAQINGDIGLWIGDLNSAAANKGYLFAFNDDGAGGIRKFRIWSRNADNVYTNLYTSPAINAWAYDAFVEWTIFKFGLVWMFFLGNTLLLQTTSTDPAQCHVVTYRFWNESTTSDGDTDFDWIKAGVPINFAKIKNAEGHQAILDVLNVTAGFTEPLQFWVDGGECLHLTRTDNDASYGTTGWLQEPVALVADWTLEPGESEITDSLEESAGELRTRVKIIYRPLWPSNTDYWTEENPADGTRRTTFWWLQSGPIGGGGTIVETASSMIGGKAIEITNNTVGETRLELATRPSRTFNLNNNTFILNKAGTKRNPARMVFYFQRVTDPAADEGSVPLALQMTSSTSDTDASGLVIYAHRGNVSVLAPLTGQWYKIEKPFELNANAASVMATVVIAIQCSLNDVFRIDGFNIEGISALIVKSSSAETSYGVAELPLAAPWIHGKEEARRLGEAFVRRIKDPSFKFSFTHPAVLDLLPGQLLGITFDPYELYVKEMRVTGVDWGDSSCKIELSSDKSSWLGIQVETLARLLSQFGGIIPVGASDRAISQTIMDLIDPDITVEDTIDIG